MTLVTSPVMSQRALHQRETQQETMVMCCCCVTSVVALLNQIRHVISVDKGLATVKQVTGSATSLAPLLLSHQVLLLVQTIYKTESIKRI